MYILLHDLVQLNADVSEILYAISICLFSSVTMKTTGDSNLDTALSKVWTYPIFVMNWHICLMCVC